METTSSKLGRILMVEDDPNDVELTLAVLEEDHLASEVIVTRDGEQALDYLYCRGEYKTRSGDNPAVMLLDLKLPKVDGLDVLKQVKSDGEMSMIPVVVLTSGALGEEVAIEALKIGATDYVLKTRLSRLVPAVHRALREARERAEHKKAEEALRRSERELRDVIETIPATAWSALPDGSHTFVNSRWAEYTGLSADQSAGSGWQAAVHPQDLQRHVGKWSASVATGEPFEDEVRFRRADGHYRWHLVRGLPLRDERGEILKWYGILTDIEDRKRAEEILREQANLLSLTHDAIFVGDMRAVISYWNRGAEELYGFSAQEAEGKLAHELLKTVFPVRFEQIRAELLSTGRWEGELVHTTKDGTPVVVASRWSLQRDDKGTPLAILETNNDTTERKRAEEECDRLRRLEADLAHMNRISMMGELAASLSHELKQPIAATVMNANTCWRWLKRDQPGLEEACEATRRIVENGKRASDIIERLRSLYKKSPPQRELVEVNEIVHEMVVLLRGEANWYAVSMRTDLAAGLPKITADRVQLQQVLMNLMLNAIEAMKDTGGGLTIKSQLEQDGRLLISVTDTGVGLPAEKADQIFNAFFTTKPQGGGMGLAISRSIVESHGGRLWASANTGPGATFHFTLPTTVAAHA